jgi:hypothetical protein
MTMKPPYCEINGLVCTDVVSSVDLKGGTSNQANRLFPAGELKISLMGAETLAQSR